MSLSAIPGQRAVCSAGVAKTPQAEVAPGPRKLLPILVQTSISVGTAVLMAASTSSTEGRESQVL